IEIISGKIQNGKRVNELNRGKSGLETYGLLSNLTQDFLPNSGSRASDSDSNPRSFKMSTRESLPSTKYDAYLNQSLTNVPSILSHFSSSNASVFDRIVSRSEERRVGKECRSRWSAYH